MKKDDHMQKSSRGRPRGFSREQAVACALALFQKQGYEGTSLAELTQAIGISAASLYGVFDSKEALFEEAVELYQNSQGAFAAKALRDAPTAQIAIHDLIHGAARQYARQDQPKGCFISTGVMQCGHEHSDIANRMSQRRKDTRDLIKHRLDLGKRQGELKETADTTALAAFYAAMLQGLSVQARDGASPADLEEIATLAMIPLNTETIILL